MPTAIHAKQNILLPSLEFLLKGMPERDSCRCGDGKPDISFDFEKRTWIAWCGCGLCSDGMSYLDHAILDFNTKNKR